MKKFNENCQRCPRLAKHLVQVRKLHPGYFSKPVPPFGATKAQLYIVGLAPGLHGANATGRPFTGDHAGILLYATLRKFGFANRSQSIHCNDGLRLINCRITNAVKCLPPQNKPLTCEIKTCNDYLTQELGSISQRSIILALGTVAHQAVLRAFNLKLNAFAFKHHKNHRLPSGHCLLDSYHCSRYNTQTKRLTPTMFENIFKTITKLLTANEAC